MLDISKVVSEVLGEHQRLAAEISRIAGNPKGLALMREIIRAVDKAESADDTEQPLNPKMLGVRNKSKQDARQGEPYAPNGLTKASWEAMRSIGGPFTIADVVDRLNNSGFKFVASKPKVAVAAPIKAYEKRKFIRLVKRGTGSDPNTYELTGLGKGSE
jgi:hypothetical protein